MTPLVCVEFSAGTTAGVAAAGAAVAGAAVAGNDAFDNGKVVTPVLPFTQPG